MDSRKVVFYGAGENAEIRHKFTLKRVGDREPVAFCDRDPHKRGRPFLGLPVMSFAEATERFGVFDIYVTVNERHAPDIIGYLLENGVQPERIINYEPVERRKGCTTLDSEMLLIFSKDHLEFYHCCVASRSGAFLLSAKPVTVLPDTVFNNKILLSVLCDKNELRKNIEQSHPSPLCNNCNWHQRLEYHYSHPKISHFGIGGFAPCNFSCFNCGNAVQWEKCTYNPWDIVLDSFKVIEDGGVMADDCLVTLSLGEHTIAKNHGEILQHLSKYPLIIFSNAYAWSEPTAEALADGNTWLRVSVDAGTRETFAKIKGVDGFDRVCQNLEKYAKCGTLVLKYIIFPKLNDDDVNLFKFVELADKLNAKINLSRDYSDGDDLSNEILKKIAKIIVYFRLKSKFYGIELRTNERRRLQELLESHGASPASQWI
jgi:pyruvate-formate lyase-activating enzyme